MLTGCPGTRFTATSWPSASRKDATTPSPAVARSQMDLEADWHSSTRAVSWAFNTTRTKLPQHGMCHISKRPLVKGSRHSCHCPGVSGTDTWWSVPMMALHLFFASNPRGGPRRQLKTARVYCQDLRKQNSFWTTKCLTKSDFDFVTLKVELKNYQNHFEIKQLCFLARPAYLKHRPKTLCFKLSITLTTSDHPILAFRTKEKAWCLLRKRKKKRDWKMEKCTL